MEIEVIEAHGGIFRAIGSHLNFFVMEYFGKRKFLKYILWWWRGRFIYLVILASSGEFRNEFGLPFIDLPAEFYQLYTEILSFF